MDALKKIVLIAASLLVLISNGASACICMATTPKKNFKNSSAVFAGKVIDIVPQSDRNLENSDSLAAFKVTFEVSQVWKGRVDEQQVVLASEYSPGCGYSFEKGEEYLVYASDSGEELAIRTGFCNTTKLLANAQADLAVLEQETSVTPEN